jgi:hypothetical protein
MRYKGYIRETFAGGLTECLHFDYAQYGEANAMYTPAAGMHESAALYLMNRWNRTSPNYKYYLGDGE